VSAERIPRGKPPNLARRGKIVTETQKLRPALSVNTQLNHVLPLAHFGATSDVCDGGVWCGPIAIVLAREVGAPNNTT
jgi:hypothetical protein